VTFGAEQDDTAEVASVPQSLDGAQAAQARSDHGDRRCSNHGAIASL
jgi:hypothetical protein